MIKRTLFFGNPAYLSTAHEQLVIDFPEKDKPQRTVPIEDVGMVVLENRQITISNALLEKLSSNNAAVVSCDARHMPIGLFMNLEGHSEQSERQRYQLEASMPLKKNLWQQTVQAKIANQAAHLAERGKPVNNMAHWQKSVNSGDTHNHEGRAAAYYWQNLFNIEGFTRHRGGIPPNNLLNYGYAVLRAITARALVGSGLLPGLGIHHRNKYSAFCLADDIMEPYRPYVDVLVCHVVETVDDYADLQTSIKQELLQLPVIDVMIDGKQSPLMVAVSRTTSSLFECYAGLSRKIIYPDYTALV